MHLLVVRIFETIETNNISLHKWKCSLTVKVSDLFYRQILLSEQVSFTRYPCF
jgi:hypothetical protein